MQQSDSFIVLAEAQRILVENALQFVDACPSMCSQQELCSSLAAVVAPLGYSAVASGRLDDVTPASAQHFQNWDAGWMALYMSRNFYSIDPAITWAQHSGLPITVAELRRRMPAGHRGLDVIEAAAPFGYAGGYIIPQRAAYKTSGLVAFVGARDPDDAGERAVLSMLAATVFERAEILKGRVPSTPLPAPPARLSARENEYLKLLAAGLNNIEIADRMSVSEITVRFHLGNLRAKTGARSRAALMTWALNSGLGDMTRQPSTD